MTESKFLIVLDTLKTIDEELLDRLSTWSGFHILNLQHALISALDLSKNPGAQARRSLHLKLHYDREAHVEACMHLAGWSVKSLYSQENSETSPETTETTEVGCVILDISSGGQRLGLPTIVITLDEELLRKTSNTNWIEKLGLALFTGSCN